jgi:hypothetical protein
VKKQLLNRLQTTKKTKQNKKKTHTHTHTQKNKPKKTHPQKKKNKKTQNKKKKTKNLALCAIWRGRTTWIRRGSRRCSRCETSTWQARTPSWKKWT